MKKLLLPLLFLLPTLPLLAQIAKTTVRKNLSNAVQVLPAEALKNLPENPTEGMIYYDGRTESFYYFDGRKWVKKTKKDTLGFGMCLSCTYSPIPTSHTSAGSPIVVAGGSKAYVPPCSLCGYYVKK